jgi:hypothetical protein
MTARWRGRISVPVILGILLLGATVAATGAAGARDPTLVVRDPGGAVVARLPLADGEFTLSYRNSVYRSLAEERYVVDSRGRIHLAGLAADELAVLEEYYAIDEPAWRAAAGARTWMAAPARPVVVERLTVAATDLGRRTLIVDGRRPLELWRLVEDAEPSVHLEVVMP